MPPRVSRGEWLAPHPASSELPEGYRARNPVYRNGFWTQFDRGVKRRLALAAQPLSELERHFAAQIAMRRQEERAKAANKGLALPPDDDASRAHDARDARKRAASAKAANGADPPRVLELLKLLEALSRLCPSYVDRFHPQLFAVARAYVTIYPRTPPVV